VSALLRATPVDRRDRAVLLACALYPIFGTGFFLYSFPLWVVPWTVDFHMARATVMSAFAAAAIVTTLVTPVVGRLLDTLSPRLTAIGGALMMGAGLWLASAARSFWLVAVPYATLVAVGAAAAGMLPAQTVALRKFPEKAGRNTGLILLGLSLGGALLPLVLAPAIARFGWRTAMALSGVTIVSVIVPLAWFFLDGQWAPRVAVGTGEGGFPQQALTTKAIFSNGDLWRILAGFLPLTFVNAALQPNVVAIGVDSGISPATAAYLVSILAVSAAVGAPIVGSLADRIDLRLVYAGLSAVIASALLVLVATPRLLFPAVAVIGLAGGGGLPLLGVLIVRRFGLVNLPRVQGLIVPLLIPAYAAPALAGWIHDRTGSYSNAFVLLALLLVPGILAICTLNLANRVRTTLPTAS
jgi:MFS family permease